ncbi:Poly(A) RNA polymerase cid14 [Quillaja saponaria]|uniref:Poly(A) RNA polymerase cid14 n=1 Tax=Quillaja saponaria TaxID=32244 RepID=A0AAD7L477_QUISA|nr:Poly(A) RNA polymerase cid14 [Quillaja saponaria]KAJ7951290.1 Poly(A) RNA polymerase cid14 [Quillaja saponaria]
MGEHEEWAQAPSGLLPNGLLPNEAASVIRVLDAERWSKAEERTAELIACIQPNQPSEERRNAVADYVQRLIMKCFPCQVFTFGSVPLKTYLPDGDIDLTAFSNNQNLKDTWAHQVRDMLENEEKNENAEFHVKEVQYIQAEVKIIKCLVENIVVDISFNQLGGLCTLCFLEEVDHLISQDHLFKRSIILIKAWCYYESRILGAHHGLISTYALETLVLYIFHVFNNSFAGPLEVLNRFLEFFSKFDWDNFCVSLWGPVPIRSLPDVTSEPPRKDGGDLLLSKLFLDACSSVYAVFPGGQENQGQPFVSKHFNVIDPLRVNNNLGRSVSKGNFFRIRSAFAFGAKRLARLLDCPKEDLYFEVNQFFMNTWDRHGSGQRPDAPRNDLCHLRLSNMDHIQGLENLNISSSQKVESTSNREVQVDGLRGSGSGPSQSSNLSSENTFRHSDVSTVSRTQSQKSYVNPNNSKTSEQLSLETGSNQGGHVNNSQRTSRPANLLNEVQGRFLFARTRSSPELTDTYGELSTQGKRTIEKGPKNGKRQIASARLDNNRRKNIESDAMASHGVRVDDSSSVRHIPHCQSLDIADSNSGSNSYHDESVSGVVGEDFASITRTHVMHQEEQDRLNMMSAHSFNGQVHVPLNLASGHLPLPFPPSILASMGYGQRNLDNVPMIETPWGAHMHFPQGLVPSPLNHYFPGMGLTSSHEDSIEPGNENFSSVEMNAGESDNDFWHEQDRASASGVEIDDGSFEIIQSDDKQQSTSGGYNYTMPSRIASSGNSTRFRQKFTKENHSDPFQYQDSRGNEVHFDDRTINSRSLQGTPASSLRSKTSSESSWEGSSAKITKSTRDKRGRKNSPSMSSAVSGKGKVVSEISSPRADENNREWSPVSTVASEVAERNTAPQSVTSMHVPRNQVPGYELAHTSRSDSLIPMSPVILGSGSRQRTLDNSGVVPFTFYPTGPPVPFVTMLPFYNFPSDTGSSDTSTSNFHGEEGVDNSDSGYNFDSAERLDQSEVSSPSNFMRRAAVVEPSEHKSDILNSDFASHWQNLQYGRFCQNSRHPAPLIYPPPVMAPPVYLQGRFPWDGPGRPLSTNMNLFTQLGPRLVPVAPLPSNRPASVYQRFADEMPRYRSGTGTYLPNPVSPRDRHSSTTRRGNYNYDRNDHHGDRDGNWNMNTKTRASGRSHSRSQAEKPNLRSERLATSESRADRPWGSHRHESVLSYQTQNGPVRSHSSQSGHPNVAYGMYPLPAMNPSASSNGPTIPSVVMLYPYDHNASYGPPAEQLEFGSQGPMGFSGVELSQQNEGRPVE